MVWMNFPCHPNFVTSVIAGSHSVALPVGIYGGQMTSKSVTRIIYDLAVLLTKQDGIAEYMP